MQGAESQWYLLKFGLAYRMSQYSCQCETSSFLKKIFSRVRDGEIVAAKLLSPLLTR